MLPSLLPPYIHAYPPTYLPTYRSIEEQEARFTANVSVHVNDLLDKAAAGEGLPDDLPGMYVCICVRERGNSS